MTRITIPLLAALLLNSCTVVDQIYENSSLGVMLIGVAIVVGIIVYLLGRAQKKSK